MRAGVREGRVRGFAWELVKLEDTGREGGVLILKCGFVEVGEYLLLR